MILCEIRIPYFGCSGQYASWFCVCVCVCVCNIFINSCIGMRIMLLIGIKFIQTFKSGWHLHHWDTVSHLYIVQFLGESRSLIILIVANITSDSLDS